MGTKRAEAALLGCPCYFRSGALMTTSEWISVIALIISSGGFALQGRNWLMSGPRLHLSVMADAISIPDDGAGDRLALTVINRGTEPTTLTHMVAYTYASRWQKFRQRSEMAGLVNSPRIPSELDVNKTWLGQMLYNNEALVAARRDGKLYVGVIAAHRSRAFTIHVPPPTKNKKIPSETIAKG